MSAGEHLEQRFANHLTLGKVNAWVAVVALYKVRVAVLDESEVGQIQPEVRHDCLAASAQSGTK